MAVWELTRTTTAAPEAVWRVWSDVVGWPEWNDAVTSVEAKPGASPLRPGSAYRLRQPRLLAADWAVTEVDDGRAFTWSSAAPGTVSVATHLVEPEGTGSRVTARLEMTGYAAGAVSLLLGRLVRRYVELEVDGVVRRAELA